MKEVAGLFHPGQFVILPAVMVPPFHPPPDSFKRINHALGSLVVPKVRYAQGVPLTLRPGKNTHDMRESSHRTEYRGNGAMHSPVNRVTAHRIKVIVGQVDHTMGTALDLGEELLIPVAPGSILPGQSHRFHRQRTE
ncbi:MAG: hypothetical protein A4E42_01884 [Methanoregulaceae archaeon PtaU1.Bin222]|nr:MAG: hypothetical protein A4E42_01884 [Methanoregulaceae archaeon PtaU1.Bin222]